MFCLSEIALVKKGLSMSSSSETEDASYFEDEPDGIEAVVAEALAHHRRRRRRSWQSSEEVMDGILCELRGKLYEAVDEHRAYLAQVPNLVERDAGSLAELAEAARVHQVIIHLLNAASGRGLHPDVKYVLTGLVTRAIATLNEIEVLLRNGYAQGARSRWRTLYEIVVVSRVLARGNRYTATRYREHSWVMLARERKRTGVYEWPSGGPTPESMRSRLLRRFGKSFDGEYGWAAVVTKRGASGRSPTWPDLVSLAEIDEHVARVQASHHAVHGGDALGLLGTVRSDAFHAGASPDGVLLAARDTIFLFAQCMESLLSTWWTFSPNKLSESALFLSRVILMDSQMNLGLRVVATIPGARDSYEAAWRLP